MANWSSLPHDILTEIALKLEFIEDFVHFSAVCRSCNYGCSMVKREWCSKMPWLLLAENTNNNPDYRRKFFSLTRRRCYQLKLPQTFGKRCWGSSCGLVVTIGLDRQLHLFNPLTQTQICLPPQSTMPNQDEVEDDEDEDDIVELARRRTYFVNKAIVLEVADGDYLVLAIHGRDFMRALAFARPGDKEWTSVMNPTNMEYASVKDVSCNGQRIYMLYIEGYIGYFDISDTHGYQPIIPVVYWNLHAPRIVWEQLFWAFGLYLVESLGDLLMVARRIENVGNGVYSTKHFEVYRLNHEYTEWEQLDDLGDVALFVGDNHSISVHASSAIGKFKCNSIYFTDDDNTSEAWGRTDEYDMGIYSMASKEFRVLYNGEDVLSKCCRPFWFMPRF